MSILDGSIQQAKEAEMNNVAVIMEAFKGKNPQTNFVLEQSAPLK